MLDFPTIFDLFARFDFLRGEPAANLLVTTAVIIVLVWDWRLSLAALALQYLLVGLLFADILDPRLAIVKVLVGLFISLILYFTARQVHWGRLPEDVRADELITPRPGRQVRFGRFLVAVNLPARILLTAVMGGIVWFLATNPDYALPAVVDPARTLAIYALTGFGLLGVSVTAAPLKAGMGLLMFMTGFELFFNGLEQSIALLAFLAAGNLALAVAIAYLTQARHMLPAIID